MELTKAAVDLLVVLWEQRALGPQLALDVAASKLDLTEAETGRRYAVLEAYGLVRAVAQEGEEGTPTLVELTPEGADFAEDWHYRGRHA